VPGVLIRIERIGSLVFSGRAYNRRETPRLLGSLSTDHKEAGFVIDPDEVVLRVGLHRTPLSCGKCSHSGRSATDAPDPLAAPVFF
jgi:hypothetical protein